MTVTMSDKDTGSVAIAWVEDKEVCMLYAMGNNRKGSCYSYVLLTC